MNFGPQTKLEVRPPGAAIPSAKSIYVVEIPLAAMAVGLQRSGDYRPETHLGLRSRLDLAPK